MFQDPRKMTQVGGGGWMGKVLEGGREEAFLRRCPAGPIPCLLHLRGARCSSPCSPSSDEPPPALSFPPSPEPCTRCSTVFFYFVRPQWSAVIHLLASDGKYHLHIAGNFTNGFPRPHSSYGRRDSCSRKLSGTPAGLSTHFPPICSWVQ